MLNGQGVARVEDPVLLQRQRQVLHHFVALDPVHFDKQFFV
jgi:hypothetical protein